MSGLINAGVGYERDAISSAVSLANTERERELANKQIKDAGTQSMLGMGGSALGILGTALFMA